MLLYDWRCCCHVCCPRLGNPVGSSSPQANCTASSNLPGRAVIAACHRWQLTSLPSGAYSITSTARTNVNCGNYLLSCAVCGGGNFVDLYNYDDASGRQVLPCIPMVTTLPLGTCRWQFPPRPCCLAPQHERSAAAAQSLLKGMQVQIMFGTVDWHCQTVHMLRWRGPLL